MELAGGYTKDRTGKWGYGGYGVTPEMAQALDRLEELEALSKDLRRIVAGHDAHVREQIEEYEANEQATNDAHTALSLEIGRLGRLLGEAEARELRLEEKLRVDL
tara:strand:- start:12 stop:326 length:315 start_codon:yes stop_codon:yes gene_type:complete